jgi:hypothetical protein
MIIGLSEIGKNPGIGESYYSKITSTTMDVTIAYTAGYVYTFYDMLSKKTLSKTYTASVRLGGRHSAEYKLGMKVVNPIKTYTANLRIVLARENRDPQDSVINVLRESWSRELDIVYQKIQMMVYDLRLDSATGSELDDLWGAIYNLKRRTNESDLSYRNRLTNYSNVLIGCGTKSSCEAIIDNILGINNSTNIQPIYPAKARIEFDNPDSMKLANTNISTLNYMIPSMLASGISYDIILPYKEYYMDILSQRTEYYSCVCNVFVQKCDIISSFYDMDILSVFNRNITVSIDTLILTHKLIRYDSNVWIECHKLIEIPIDMLLTKNCITQISVDVLLKGTLYKNWYSDVLIYKQNILKNISLNTIIMMSRRSRYNMGVSIR